MAALVCDGSACYHSLLFAVAVAALVSVSEEVRSRCHLKHRFCMHISESASNDSISGELQPPPAAPTAAASLPHHQLSPAAAAAAAGAGPTGLGTGASSWNEPPPPPPRAFQTGGVCGAGAATPVEVGGAEGGEGGGGGPARRQKSCDALDQAALAQARATGQKCAGQAASQVQQVGVADCCIIKQIIVFGQFMERCVITLVMSSLVGFYTPQHSTLYVQVSHLFINS